jgi:erythromycin esterase
MSAAGALFSLAGCKDVVDGLSENGTVTPRGPNMVIGAPQLWGGTFNAQFEVGNDYGAVHGGRASAFVRMLQPRHLNETQFGQLVQNIRADAYVGTRIKVSAWLRTTGLTGDHGAGLWLRVDGRAFNLLDNTDDRRITTATDWQQMFMVTDVPDDAIGLTYGVLLASTGIVWVDDFRIEVVDETVPVTTVQIPVTLDEDALLRVFEVLPMAPRNLDFEGDVAPASRPDTRDWVLANSFAFSTDDPSAPLAELEPLRAKVGNATIVGLGEATHGTREFQRMKHRIVQFLVSEMGFSHFGMEAPFSSAMMFDHYLQTGEGDPAHLLEAWYMWPWATEELLELIKWMRSWNAAGNTPKVHFYGVEFPDLALAIDTVKAFVKRMDPATGEHVDSLYDCLDEIRNVIDPWDILPGRYIGLPKATQQACRAGFEQVGTILSAHETEWSAREGGGKMRLVRQLAVIPLQWETWLTLTTDRDRAFYRDQVMAENASWWHDVGAPGAKLMWWAHNGHIVKRFNQTGGHLAAKYGASYFNIGFTFGLGSFNASYLGIPGDTLPLLRTHSVAGYRADGIETIFATIGQPRLIFDARAVRGPVTDATEPLLSPLAIRAIGNSFSPRYAVSSFHQTLQLAKDYDLIVWFAQTTPTTLRPLPPLPPP